MIRSIEDEQNRRANGLGRWIQIDTVQCVVNKQIDAPHLRPDTVKPRYSAFQGLGQNYALN